jgi:signal transduction histidine kinase
LTAELSDRLDLIRRQATELTASRARVAQTQDAERQRIQRDLHDGVQQDLVALTANLALARERLRRGDPRADESLAELQRDMRDLLGQLRDFAHAIHPPVLADQGLLEAIEAQAARLPLEVVIEADPALRGVRSLADRIAIVNGTLHIDSAPGQGTTLRAEVPLAAVRGCDG